MNNYMLNILGGQHHEHIKDCTDNCAYIKYTVWNPKDTLVILIKEDEFFDHYIKEFDLSKNANTSDLKRYIALWNVLVTNSWAYSKCSVTYGSLNHRCIDLLNDKQPNVKEVRRKINNINDHTKIKLTMSGTILRFDNTRLYSDFEVDLSLLFTEYGFDVLAKLFKHYKSNPTFLKSLILASFINRYYNLSKCCLKLLPKAEYIHFKTELIELKDQFISDCRNIYLFIRNLINFFE